jgi:OOP family OmpA-OmpF porin
MRTVIGAGIALCGLAMSAAASRAMATELDRPSDELYVSGAGLFEIPDGGRNSQNGYGLQLTGGMPLVDHPGYAVEISYTLVTRKREIDGSSDNQSSALINLSRDFGTYRWSARWAPKFKPFVVGGIGAVQDDVEGHQRINPGFDVGGGLKFPLGYLGATLRTQVSVIGEYNIDQTQGMDQPFYADFHVLAGLDFPIGVALHHAKVAPTTPANCGLAVVDPISGRKGCAVDSDHDGVPDNLDHCPDTPVDSKVDAKGCQILDGL